MTKLTFYAAFLTFFFCSVLSFDANSFELLPDHKTVDGAVLLQKFSEKDRTFSISNKLDRYFFSKDKKFIFQIIHDTDPQKISRILTGSWSVTNDKLCLAYSDNTIQKYSLKNTDECFKVFIDKDEAEARFLRSAWQDVYLVAYPKEDSLSKVISFSSWGEGALIFDPDLLSQTKMALNGIKNILKQHKGVIPQGITERAQLSPLMQNYYDMVVGRVYTINGDFYSLFLPSGQYIWLSAADILEANGDAMKLEAKLKYGTWRMTENVHCWESGSYGASCLYIYPLGTGLYSPYDEGILTLHNTGRLELHSTVSGSSRHIPFSQSPFASLPKLEKMSVE